GQHTHMVGGDAVHLLGLLRDATKEVPPADDDGGLHPECMHVGQFASNLMDAGCVNAKATLGSKGFTGELEQNTFENGSGHKKVSSFGVSSFKLKTVRCLRAPGTSKPETRNLLTSRPQLLRPRRHLSSGSWRPRSSPPRRP